jgi:hypothetical protein
MFIYLNSSVEAYGELKEQLGLKEGEVEKAKFTTQGLSQQEAHLKSQMTRVLFKTVFAAYNK